MQSVEIETVPPASRKARLQFFGIDGFSIFLVWAFGILIAVGWMARQNSIAATRAEQKKSNSDLVNEKLKTLLSSLKDAQNGTRGFVISGKDEFLQPYFASLGPISTGPAELLRMTADNVGQQQRLRALEPRVSAMQEYLQSIIELRRTQGFEAAASPVADGRGDQLMDEIRALIGSAILEENALQQNRIVVKESNQRKSLLAVIGGTALGIIMLVALIIYSRRELKSRKLAENSLQQLNKTLEQRVNERTETVRESAQRLVLAMDAASMSSWEWNLVTDAIGWSENCEVLLGHATDDPIKTNADFQLRMHPDDVERQAATVRTSIAQRVDYRCEFRVLWPDGSMHWLSSFGRCEFDAEGRPVRMIGMMMDVNARKLAEGDRARLESFLTTKNVELERAIEVADKANQAKSEFLSSMSHELRTPLGAILGFAQLIDSSEPSPSPSQKSSLEQILKAGWYLLDLINEILDLALIESGKLTLSMEAISLSEVLHECQTMIEPQAQARSIVLTFPGMQRAIWINADRTRVKQVLINLLSNAIKYNNPGGKVLVTCELASPTRVTIGVEDAGDGLSPAQQLQLFQPFNRLGRENSGEQGTGIGLVVSKRLVELMGGAIGVESAPGKGCVFWIELNLIAEPQPMLAGHRVSGADTTAPTPVAPLGTLLYVEDNPANLLLVEELVARRTGLRMLSAGDGDSGVALALRALPDVILMDVNLPGISGFEALQLLQTDPATAHIPVLALSANAMPRDIEQGLAAGFFRYLTKPIKVHEFMLTLDDALNFAHANTARQRALPSP